MEKHHSHHEHHDHCSHGHKHGLVKRTLASAERSVNQSGNKTFTKRLAAAALRGSSLLMCPGDDILTVGAGVMESIIGDAGQDHKQHTEATGILPGQTRFDFGRNVVYLHKPSVETVAPPRPAPQSTVPARTTKERFGAAIESIKRRTRLAVLGGLGVAMATGLLGTSATHELPEEMPRTPSTSAEVPDITVISPPIATEYTTVSSGDSQWTIAAQKSSVATPNNQITLTATVHRLTTYYNEASHPNPNLIHVGEQLRVPSTPSVERLHRAIVTPSSSPEIASAITELTHLAETQAEEGRMITIRLDSLLA